MQQQWDPEELIARWTLLDNDWRLVNNKTGATRLGFALLLKFFEQEGRFPRSSAEVPKAAVGYVAKQVRVDPAQYAAYQLSGRSSEVHRAQIRREFGFREATREDEARFIAWLAKDVCPVELSDPRVREALAARCRIERVEPPGRPERIIGAARSQSEKDFCTRTVSRLSAQTVARLKELVAEDDTDGIVGRGPGMLAEVKADPGVLGLETLLKEIDKLARIRSLGLPEDLFADASDKLVASWRERASREYAAWIRKHPEGIQLTLLAALCSVRKGEVTDSLVDLLIALVNKVNATAVRRVEGELLDDLKRVRGKQGILFALATAAVDHPNEIVREALYPVVGEATLRELVREAKANAAAFSARVRVVLHSSYSNHYRRGFPKLLAALQFRSNNTIHRPVMDALELLARYAERPSAPRYYDRTERVPLDGVVPAPWLSAVVDEAGRVERIPYELCVLTALREGIRRREIWVVGAHGWRNPEDDLPGDFEANRDVHYAALTQPIDASEFIASLKQRLGEALTGFDQALIAGAMEGVKITTRHGEPWIGVPKLDKLVEPENLTALKGEVAARWGTIDLLDMLKEADFDTSFTEEFASVAQREIIPAALRRRRLLLVLFALGTNLGIKQMVETMDAGEYGETEASLRRARLVYITRDNLRSAIARVVNKTLAVRDPA